MELDDIVFRATVRQEQPQPDDSHDRIAAPDDLQSFSWHHPSTVDFIHQTHVAGWNAPTILEDRPPEGFGLYPRAT